MINEFNLYELLCALSAYVDHFLEDGDNNISPSAVQDELELLIHLL